MTRKKGKKIKIGKNSNLHVKITNSNKRMNRKEKNKLFKILLLFLLFLITVFYYFIISIMINH